MSDNKAVSSNPLCELSLYRELKLQLYVEGKKQFYLTLFTPWAESVSELYRPAIASCRRS
jgi:hypothetical protein